MLKSFAFPLLRAADGGSGSGSGTTEKAAGSGSSSGGSSGGITHGTADAAMIAAAQAALSQSDATGAGKSGDTSPAGGAAGTSTDTGTAGTGAAGTGAAAGSTAAGTGQPGAAPGTRGDDLAGRGQAIAQRARSQVLSDYGLVDQSGRRMNPEVVRDAMQFFMEFRRDPAAFWREMGNQLRDSGVSGEDEPLPEPKHRDPGGKWAAYDAAQMPDIIKVLTKNISRQLMGQFAPMMQYFDSERQARTESEMQAAVDERHAAIMAEARKWPGFTKENEPAITAVLVAMPAALKKALGPAGALYHAYQQFYNEKIRPTERATIEKELHEANRKKARAADGSQMPVGSGGSETAPKLRDGDVSGLAAHLARLAEQQSAGA